MNTFVLECDLQYGPSSSDYVQSMIARVMEQCDYVDEVYANVNGSMNIDVSDMSRIRLLIVECLAANNGATYGTVAWTDRVSQTVPSAKKVYPSGLMRSIGVTDPDPASNITLDRDAGDVDIRIIIAGNL